MASAEKGFHQHASPVNTFLFISIKTISLNDTLFIYFLLTYKYGIIILVHISFKNL